MAETADLEEQIADLQDAASADVQQEDAPASRPKGYIPFSAVAADPRWDKLKPSEKTQVLDNWTAGLREFGAKQGWNPTEFNKTVDEKSAQLRYDVLDNHVSTLQEVPVALAQTLLATGEALPRKLSLSGETKEQGLQRFDDLISEQQKAIDQADAEQKDNIPTRDLANRLTHIADLKAQREAIANGKDTYYTPESQAGIKAFQDQMKGWADSLQAIREKLPEDQGINPATHDSMMAGVARGVGQLIGMVNPAGPAVLAGTTFTEGADQAITQAKADGETDPDKLSEIGNYAGQTAIAKSLPQLAAYMLGGPIAGQLTKSITAPVLKGLVGAAASAATNLTVSGTSRAIEGQPFIGDAQQNTMDIGFGGLGGLHAGKEAAQKKAQFESLKNSVHSELAAIDLEPTATADQKQAAKDDLLNQIEEPGMRSVISSEYEADKAKAPVDQAATELEAAVPDSPTAAVARETATETEDAATEAQIKRDHETAVAEAATLEAAELQAAEDKRLADEKAAKEAAKPEPASAKPDVAPEPAPVIPDTPDIPIVEAPRATDEAKAPAVPEVGSERLTSAEPLPAEPLPIVDEAPLPVAELPPEPAAPPVEVDPERKAMVDAYFGDKDNYAELHDRAAHYISKRAFASGKNQNPTVAGLDANDLVQALYQKALTKKGMKTPLDIEKGAVRFWEDIAGRKKEAGQEHTGPSLDQETAAGTVGDVIPEASVSETAAKTRAEEAQTLIEELRGVLTPEELKIVEDLADGNADKRRAEVKAVVEKVRDHVAQKTEKIPAPEPNEHDAEPFSEADRKYAVDRAYKLYADKQTLTAEEYKDFKNRLDDAETLGELDAIHRELDAKTPAERAKDLSVIDRLALRQVPAQVRERYRLGGPLHEALRRLAGISEDVGRRELAIRLESATNPGTRTRVNSSLRPWGRIQPDEGLIEINPFNTHERIEETILHEALHDATIEKVHDFTDNGGKRLTVEERDALTRLEELRQEALGHAPVEVRRAAASRGDEGERYRAAVHSNPRSSPMYGLMSLREFVSEMFVSPEFKDFLNSHKALTTAPRAERITYWHRAIQLLSRLFGAKPGTILHEALRSSVDLFERPPLRSEESPVPAESTAKPEPIDTALEKRKDLLDRATELRDAQARLRGLRKEELGQTRPLPDIAREHFANPGDTSLADKLVAEGGLDKTNAAGVARILEREMTPPVVDPVEKSPQALGIVPGYADINEPLVKMWANTKNFLSTFKPGTWWKAWYNAADNKAGLFAMQKGNDVRGALRESMGRSLSSPERLHALDRRALAFVVEAHSDPTKLAGFRQQIKDAVLNGTFKKTVRWNRKASQALDAIDHAESNFNRLEPAADVYRQITDNQLKLEHGNGIATNFRKGYVPHIQEFDSGLNLPFDRSQGSAGTSFKKVRSFDTFADSLSAGVKPRTLDAVEALENRLKRGNMVINRQKWAEAGKSLTDPRSTRPVVADMIVSKHPLTGDSFSKPPRGYEMRSLGNQTIAVHHGYADIFDQMTDPSYMAKSVARRGTMWTAGTIKHGLLLFDTFHLGRLAYYQLPLRYTKAFSFKQGLLSLDYSSAELTNMERRGELPKGITAQDLIARKDNLATLVNAGYNLGGIQEAMYAGFVRKLPFVGGFNRFVFEKFQRGGMALTGLMEFERQRAAYPKLSDQDVARMVAKDLNTRFGNLRKEGWLASDTTRDLAQLIFLAPSWNEGLIRSEFGAAKQLGVMGKDLVTQRQLHVGTLLKGSGTLMLGVLAMNQIINYITRGHPTWENKEEGLNSKISAWIPDRIGGGPGFFLNPLALPAELTHQTMSVMERGKSVGEALAEVIGYKFGPALRVPYTFKTRTDRFGRALNSDWDVINEMVLDLAPFPITGQSVISGVQSVGKGQVTEQYKGAIEKQLFASGGIKLDGAPSDNTRIHRLADEFNRAQGIIKDPRYSASDYTALSQAIDTNDPKRAKEEFDKLAKTKTQEQIDDHYANQVDHPFTGSDSREEDFLDTLSPEQKNTYEKAVKEREKLLEKYTALQLEAPEPTH